jgi:hypothetical protein
MTQQWCDRTQLSINPQKMVTVPFTRKRDLRGLNEPTVSGHPLQLTTKVKYPGLILDKGLTWWAQLKNVMNKAYRACGTCKGTLGKTWSLKPRSGYWIHTTVIRPMLTYGPMVWLPRLKYKVSRTEHSRLHTLTCLATKGAMAPTAAVDILIGLSPHLT